MNKKTASYVRFATSLRNVGTIALLLFAAVAAQAGEERAVVERGADTLETGFVG